MNLTFHIKTYILGILVFAYGFVSSQEKQEPSVKSDWQKLGFGSIEYAQPSPTGDNFFGQGLQGRRGFNLKAQFFVYKHIFIAGTYGSSVFGVTDKAIVGNYESTKVQHQYINIGYEILPFRNIRMGLSLSVIGQSVFENESFTDNREAFQYDHGNVRSYEFYLDYMINDEFALYCNYTFRNDKMKIQTAPEIQSLFQHASFHNFGIGIKLYFGQESVLPGVLK